MFFQIKKTEPSKQEDKMKLVDQSSFLIAETNKMRQKYKEVLRHNLKMESLLGFKSSVIAPKEAVEKLNIALATKAEIIDMYKEKIEVCMMRLSLKSSNNTAKM